MNLFLQFCVVAQVAIIKKYLAKIGEIQNMKTKNLKWLIIFHKLVANFNNFKIKISIFWQLFCKKNENFDRSFFFTKWQ
jgi:hypothetical protein